MQPSTPPITDTGVAAAFAAFPEPVRAALLRLRALIFDTAAASPGVGRVTETLKWGQPAYLTAETKSGTTIRLGQPKAGGYAVFTHCQTRVMPEFAALFPGDFTFDGTRAVLFPDGAAFDEDKLRLLIRSALTYHLPPPK